MICVKLKLIINTFRIPMRNDFIISIPILIHHFLVVSKNGWHVEIVCWIKNRDPHLFFVIDDVAHYIRTVYTVLLKEIVLIIELWMEWDVCRIRCIITKNLRCWILTRDIMNCHLNNVLAVGRVFVYIFIEHSQAHPRRIISLPVYIWEFIVI